MILEALPLPLYYARYLNTAFSTDSTHTGDNQFGFKKGIGCNHAIYSCRNIVDHFVNSGSTVNILSNS